MADPVAEAQFRGMVSTSELQVRLGAWTWKEDNTAPAWAVLQNCKLHDSVKYTAVREAFGTPRVVVTTVASTEDNIQSVNVKRAGSKEKNITLYSGLTEVPEGVRSLNLRCAVWRITNQGHRPPLVLEAISNGVPLLLWGEPGKTESIMTHIRNKFKVLTIIPIQMYIKTKQTPLHSRHKFMEMEAFIIAVEKRIKGQVYSIILSVFIIVEWK